MYKLCLLVACLACASDGRRLKERLGQHLSSEDVKGQKIMKQLNSVAGSRSHGQANRSGIGRFAENMATPRKVVPILLAFFSPAVVFAPISNGLQFNSSIHNTTSDNPIGANAGPHGVMMDQTYMEEALPEVRRPTVRVVVTVDWEGSDLREENLRPFERFREAHPEVPLTHFLNAAYFTRSGVESMHDEWSPSQALSPIDELGLTIHGWKSLVESSGVQYHSQPNIFNTPEQLEKSLAAEKELRVFMEVGPLYGTSASKLEWDNSLDKIELQNHLSQDVGYDIDIRAYSVNELRAIISNSKVILEEHGLKVGKSFRVGSRLAGSNVLEAFQHEGFHVNSSATNLDEMTEALSPTEKAGWKDVPLSALLREIWPDVTKESQPFVIETPVGRVLEMPDTGGPQDYATAEDMVKRIDSAVQLLDSEDRFVHLGFHQETAEQYAPMVIAAITEIKGKYGHQVVFETLEASARRAMSMRLPKFLMLRKILEKPHVAQNS